MTEDVKKEKYKRPSWDEYFINIMEAIAKRSTCDRGRSGCVIAKDRQLISAGYVGSPIGEKHCDDIGHLFQKRYNPDGTYSQHCVRTVHAEQNAICQAAKRGVPVEGATLYCRMTPCPICAKMIINCGIKRVVCQKRYHDGAEAERLFLRAGISLEHISEEEEGYAGKGNVKEDLERRPLPLDRDKAEPENGEIEKIASEEISGSGEIEEPPIDEYKTLDETELKRDFVKLDELVAQKEQKLKEENESQDSRW